MIVLEAGVLRELVPMRDAIDAVRGAFLAVAEGRADQPQRLSARDASALAMLARVAPADDIAFKVVTIRPLNRSVGLPNIHAVVLLFDGPTGRPTALIEGSALTALRTGAASGVATNLLAPADARVLALIGAGAQAPDQIDAVCAVREIAEIRIVSRGGMTARALAQRVAEQRPSTRVHAVASVREAVAGADVVCCATNSNRALLRRNDLREDVHVNAIGAYTASMCELGPDVLGGARLVAVDEVSAALAEAGDVIQAINSGVLSVELLRELGDLCACEPRQLNSPGLTVFKSVGIAAQDWAIARLAYERATELELASVNLGGAAQLCRGR